MGCCLESETKEKSTLREEIYIKERTVTWDDVLAASKLKKVSKTSVKSRYEAANNPANEFKHMDDYIDALLVLYPDVDKEPVLKLKTGPKIQHKRESIPAAMRRDVWVNCYGMLFSAKCCICDITIEALGQWDSSHIVASSKGGHSSLDNLRPLCHSCNVSMRDRNMREYIRTHYPNNYAAIYDKLKL